jgi:hypothetical protein
VSELMSEARRAGYDRVRIEGGGDIADICRLTCLEQGMRVTSSEDAPALIVHGMKVFLQMESKA